MSENGDQSNRQERTRNNLEFSKPGPKLITPNDMLGKRKVKAPCYPIEETDKQFYDENGLFILTREDICDCLRKGCPGCHFKCKKCSSTKCGSQCRSNRTWWFEKCEIEGLSMVRFMSERGVIEYKEKS